MTVTLARLSVSGTELSGPTRTCSPVEDRMVVGTRASRREAERVSLRTQGLVPEVLGWGLVQRGVQVHWVQIRRGQVCTVRVRRVQIRRVRVRGVQVRRVQVRGVELAGVDLAGVEVLGLQGLLVVVVVDGWVQGWFGVAAVGVPGRGGP